MRNGFFSTACLTWALVLPLAIVTIIWGGRALIWILEHLPQN